MSERAYSGQCISNLIELVDGISGRSRLERIANAICSNREGHRGFQDGIACSECALLATKVSEVLEFPGKAGSGNGEGATTSSGEPSPKECVRCSTPGGRP